jgi:hypothetical protein
MSAMLHHMGKHRDYMNDNDPIVSHLQGTISRLHYGSMETLGDF